jgi:hypothetical protein
MTSNLRNFRETFGILDSNGEMYSDIIGASLQNRIIDINTLHRGFLTLGSYKYTIHCDLETFQTICNENEAYCVVSFQRRTTGNYAMVRKYKLSLVKKEI